MTISSTATAMKAAILHDRGSAAAKKFDEQVRINQERLSDDLKSAFDFIVCGSGSSGSVVARRLAENPKVNVLLLEAGGSDDVPSVNEPGSWPANLGSERDWAFASKPNSQLNGRSIPMNMGKVLGGGSSINVMMWSRGHKNDWDYFAKEADDRAWNYESILDIYRNIEDWQGIPDPARRGSGGLVFVQPPVEPNPIAPAMLDAARSIKIPTFEDHNGEMMEGDGGAALSNLRICNGQRLSVFRTYVYPYMDRPNLTVLSNVLVTRILFEDKQAKGVEALLGGKLRKFHARLETVLSLGAINTPKVLLQSGIGDETELHRLGIPLVQHLPGVGQNFQDHLIVASCIWEYAEPLTPRNNGVEVDILWKSDPLIDTPDLQLMQAEFPITSPDLSGTHISAGSWALIPSLQRPKSRGYLKLTGRGPLDAIEIYPNALSDPDDLEALVKGVELCRAIGNSTALKRFAKHEIMPGNLNEAALEDFIRNAGLTQYHQTCTAKMGRDSMSVVNGRLQVYGIGGLRIADGSIFPRVPTGNPMAPCVVIGERAGALLKAKYAL